MSIISSRPLTKLKQQASHNQRPLKVKQQQLHQKQITFKHQMASKIQQCWRNYLLQKQLNQQQLIYKLLLNINEISSQVCSYQSRNIDLKNQLQQYEDNFEELISHYRTKEIERTKGVFRKTFNSGMENEIQLCYVGRQLDLAKENCQETQKILDDLIECRMVLERQEEEIMERDREYQGKGKELEEMIDGETIQMNQLEYQYERLMAVKNKRECENRFRQYIN